MISSGGLNRCAGLWLGISGSNVAPINAVEVAQVAQATWKETSPSLP
jgi:hypothetical protein